MISLATNAVAGSLLFVMPRVVRAASSPTASRAISSGPNETSYGASGAWITSDIGYALLGSRSGRDRAAEMIVVIYDIGFAKISQRSAFRDQPVAGNADAAALSSARQCGVGCARSVRSKDAIPFSKRDGRREGASKFQSSTAMGKFATLTCVNVRGYPMARQRT